MTEHGKIPCSTKQLELVLVRVEQVRVQGFGVVDTN
jgi:hypothetical protein